MERRRSRLASELQRHLVEHFVAGTPARTAAELVGVHRHTATLYYRKLREVIAQQVEDQSPFAGEVEIDESYFGSHKRGKRGRGAPGKVPVFGILKRGGKVYTVMVPNVARSTLMPIIRERVRPDSLVYTDGFSSYEVLDVSGFRHHRIDHEKIFSDGQGQHRGRRYNGIPRAAFPLFLKECEWRFNYGTPSQLRATLLHWMNLD